jgi:carbonic anhydrase
LSLLNTLLPLHCAAFHNTQVKTIILCGHYNCGAVKAALQLPHTTPGLVNCWISDIRECRNQAGGELRGLDPEQQLARWAAHSVRMLCCAVAAAIAV